MSRSSLRRGAAVLLAAAAAVAGAAPVLAQQPAYQDARVSDDARVRDLLSRMTLEEKVGQLGQINSWVLLGDRGSPWDWPADLNSTIVDDVFAKDKIGHVLSGGGAWPPPPRFSNDGRGWAQYTNEIQRLALDPARNRLGIPITYGADAVHGHNNLNDAVNVPHEIGLGATFDPELVAALGDKTAAAVRATGVQWNFAPVLDVQRDLRWGRSYEPFGEDPLVIRKLGAAFVRGSQGRDISDRDKVAVTAKHFTGYGAPDNGHDRTDATIPETELQDLHLPPFADAIDAGVATVMVNSGSVNGEPVHASHRLLTDILRGQLGFKGVVISDWNDIEALWHKYGIVDNMEDAVAAAINAGVDVSMIPLVPDNAYDGRPDHGFVEAAAGAVSHGKISQARLDQAVSRVLAMKFKLGLFEHPYVDPDRANSVVEDPAQRPLARRAAQESLVLLENHDGTLPLSGRTRKLLVTGPQSDSVSHQLGGWTIGWQGAFNLTNGVTEPQATTLREGITQAAGAGTQVIWKQGAPVGDTTDRDGPGAHPEINDPDNPAVAAARAEAVAAAQDADAVVVAVGESPYAEGQGDDDTPQLSAAQAKLVDDLQATGKPVVIVVVAGRPLAMSPQLDDADAALMAFLPGAEGGRAIADTLFGDANPSGRLTVSWPKSVSQVPLAYNEPGRPYDPRYAFGHGLSYSKFSVSDLDAPSHVGRHGRVRVEADIANSSRRGGDYIALAFVERLSGPPSAAPRQLVAFDRVRLRGHDRADASLSFDVDELAVTQAGGKSVPPGTYRLVVGNRSKTFRVG